jgi:hypothetical protein
LNELAFTVSISRYKKNIDTMVKEQIAQEVKEKKRKKTNTNVQLELCGLVDVDSYKGADDNDAGE